MAAQPVKYEGTKAISMVNGVPFLR